LILLEPEDFVAPTTARLDGRRADHILRVHRAREGDALRAGVLNGKMGTARVQRLWPDQVELLVEDLDIEPPAPLPLRLVLALPRPKVLNRTIAAAASLGVKQIDLINAWRVEKAYWASPRLSEANLRYQSVLGLEQAVDTVLPEVRLHRLFAPFVRETLPGEIAGRTAILAHPGSTTPCPRAISSPAVLAIGPEGGFIDYEVSTFTEIGFTAVAFGPRILRVETALAAAIGRLGEKQVPFYPFPNFR
jgi:RsmE family RNA methyltransferase